MLGDRGRRVGRACVAMAAPGINDSVVDGRTGWVVEPGHDFGHALADALAALADENRGAGDGCRLPGLGPLLHVGPQRRAARRGGPRPGRRIAVGHGARRPPLCPRRHQHRRHVPVGRRRRPSPACGRPTRSSSRAAPRRCCSAGATSSTRSPCCVAWGSPTPTSGSPSGRTCWPARRRPPARVAPPDRGRHVVSLSTTPGRRDRRPRTGSAAAVAVERRTAARHSVLLSVSAGVVGVASYACALVLAHLLPPEEFGDFAAGQVLLHGGRDGGGRTRAAAARPGGAPARPRCGGSGTPVWRSPCSCRWPSDARPRWWAAASPSVSPAADVALAVAGSSLAVCALVPVWGRLQGEGRYPPLRGADRCRGRHSPRRRVSARCCWVRARRAHSVGSPRDRWQCSRWRRARPAGVPLAAGRPRRARPVGRDGADRPRPARPVAPRCGGRPRRGLQPGAGDRRRRLPGACPRWPRHRSTSPPGPCW